MSAGFGAPPMDGDRAAMLLAQLVNEELGADVKPHDILRMIARRWARLSYLSHTIHRAIEARQKELYPHGNQ
jgi:hypothetical protein